MRRLSDESAEPTQPGFEHADQGVRSNCPKPALKPVQGGNGGRGGGTVPLKMDVLVTLDEGQADRAAAVADDLRAAGLDVTEVLAEIGVVTGSIEPSRLNDLARVSGVAAVEPSRDVQLPSPDEPVQ